MAVTILLEAWSGGIRHFSLLKKVAGFFIARKPEGSMLLNTWRQTTR